jgi:hypothetical protein
MGRAILGLVVMGVIVVALSCGSSSSPPTGDCPIGTFRPTGISDCVVPADNAFVADTRCQGSAQPPVCLSDSGTLRPYFSPSDRCAPGYHLMQGECQGSAGFGGPMTGVAGATGAAFVGDGTASTGTGSGFVGDGTIGLGDGFEFPGDGVVGGFGVDGVAVADGNVGGDGSPNQADAGQPAEDAASDGPVDVRDASDASGGSGAD